MPRFKIAKRRHYTLGPSGVSFKDGDDLSPSMLRKLADMMEKENPEAYGKATMEIGAEERRVDIGMLDDGRRISQYYTKKMHIEVDILSPVFVLEEDGTLTEIV